MRIVGTLALLLLSLPAQAWSEFQHRQMTHAALEKVATDWGLEKAVTVRSFDDFLSAYSKMHPAITTREAFANALKINPKSPFDQISGDEQRRQTMIPIEILSLHASDPDDGRDKDLPPEVSKDARWFGVGTGVSTQAFRHIEKPPFSLWHPINTFGFPFRKLGEATERVRIYFDLAREARQAGDDYWAWRFLACSLHYIEDLTQPFHAAQAPPAMLWLGFKGYWNWGRETGQTLIGTVAHIISNAHHFLEAYAEWQTKEPTPVGSLWLKKIVGTKMELFQNGVVAFARATRDRSNTRASETMRTVIDLTADNLTGPATFDMDKTPPDDPRPMLRTDAKARLKAASALNGIIERELEWAGRDIRSLVQRFLTVL